MRARIPAIIATTPNRLFNHLEEVLGTRRDSEIASKCNILCSSLSYLRAGKRAFTPAIILKIHDATGISVDKIRDLAGITYEKRKE